MSTAPRIRSYQGSGRRASGIERIAQGFGRRWLTDWPRQVWDMPLAVPSRRHSIVVLVLGALIAAANLAIVLYADLDWVWADGRSRLTIARSILDNKQPGFTQFGNTWLPLHPAMMLPLVWIDWAYRSGAAGIAISVGALVASIYYLHRFVYVITRSATASFVAAFAMVISPNYMFMAGTPMSETPFSALTIAAFYHLVVWSKDPAMQQRALTMSGLCVGAAAMIRYEAWSFIPIGALFMVIARLQHGERPTGDWQRRVEGELLAFVSLASFPIFLYVVYNWLIFGSPDAFLRGTEALVVEQAAGLDLEGNVHNVVAVVTYTTLDNVGWIAAAVALFGFAAYAVIARRPVGLISLLLPFAPLVFILFSMYTGGSVLRHDAVYEGTGLLNARYGVVAIPAAAVGLGALAAFGRLPALAVIVVLVVQFAWFMTSPQPIITVRDATQSGYTSFEATADAFNELYDGGDVLMSFRDHAQMLPALDIHLSDVMHEGVSQTQPNWTMALEDPARYVRWIVIREDGQGKLEQLISPVILERDFDEVALLQQENPHIVERIYKVKPRAEGAQ